MKVDKCVKGVKHEKHVINVTRDRHINTEDALKKLAAKCMNSKRCEKKFNTCNEKAVSYNSECVNGKTHGCYHQKCMKSQQANKKFEKQAIVVGRVGSPHPGKKGATTL